MEFREFAEVVYPVGKGVQPPPVNPSDPQTWSKYDYWRIVNGNYYPTERKIVEQQKIERAQQRAELKEFGVIFTQITPFKLDITVKANPWKNIG